MTVFEFGELLQQFLLGRRRAIGKFRQPAGTGNQLDSFRAAQHDVIEAPLPAVVNVGRRPTVKPDDPVLAEAHVIDWSGDLYGQRVELAFLHHLREERRFPDLDALRLQIGRDRDLARERLAAG